MLPYNANAFESGGPVDLILYHTSGCHLCELAEVVIAQAREIRADIRVTHIDIAQSDELMKRYGWTIPVLARGEAELNWPFDLAKLQEWLA
jgi:hypothetical protein